MPNVVRDIGYAMLPCNWLQCQENSLDPVHLEWLHSAFTNYVLEKLDRPERVNQKKHAKIGFDVFEYGIVKRRVVVGGTRSKTPPGRTGTRSCSRTCCARVARATARQASAA